MEQHPLLVFTGSGCRDLTNRITKFLPGVDDPSPSVQAALPLGFADLTPHPNGETMVSSVDEVRNKDIFVVVSLCHRHATTENDPYTGVNDNVMELLTFGDVLSRSSAHRLTAVIPFFGYARQDRKAAGRTPITARLIADLIVEAGFNRVLTMDLHAPQIQGFFTRKVPLDHLNAGKIITDYLQSLNLRNAVVLSPDAGNLKKADKYRAGLNIGLAVVDKRRDGKGKVTSVRIIGDDVKGKTVLILDDMISTGGTVCAAIRLALENGAKEFYVAATHPEFVGPAIENLSIPEIREIIVTDTIPLLPGVQEALPITVLSISELFGESIYRIHVGESISALLGDFGS